MGRRKVEWQNTEYILGLFGDKETNTRRNYSLFVRKGIEHGKRPDLSGGGLLRSHGGWAGVRALKDFEADAISSQPCSRTGKTTCREQFLFYL
jgi:hypothetical protein